MAEKESMKTDQQPKFCVNCRWYEAIAAEYGTGYICKHAESEADKQGPKWDLVSGKESSPFDRYRACGTMRGSMTSCGPDAKLWEERV